MDRHLTEIHSRKLQEVSWEYPTLEDVMEEEMWEVGLGVVEAYVLRGNNMVVQCY